MGDAVVEQLLASTLSGFLLCNVLVYQVSVAILLVIYVIIAGLLFYFLFGYLPAKHKGILTLLKEKGYLTNHRFYFASIKWHYYV
jgi:hypothetical protein